MLLGFPPMRVIKLFGVALAAAACAGLVVGALGRLLMRLATLASGHDGEFSWSGSLFIILLYAVTTLPAALAAAVTIRRWRWLAGAAAALALCLPAGSVAAVELGYSDGWTTAQWVGVAASTVAVFATIFAAPVVATRLVDRVLGRA